MTHWMNILRPCLLGVAETGVLARHSKVVANDPHPHTERSHFMKWVFCNQGQREVKKVGLWRGPGGQDGLARRFPLEPDHGQLTLRAMFRAALQRTRRDPPPVAEYLGSHEPIKETASQSRYIFGLRAHPSGEGAQRLQPRRTPSLRIPVISATQSGGMPAPSSGASRPGSERIDAGHSVISHTPQAVSSPPGSSASSRLSG